MLLVRKKYENIQKLIHEIQLDQNLHSKFTWKDNQLRYKGRLWLGDQSKIKKTILQEAHGGVAGGNSGVKKILEKVRRAFYRRPSEISWQEGYYGGG